MTSIERTAYPQFKRLTSARVLHVFFTPTAEEIAWAKERAGNPEALFALVLDLKCFQKMARFCSREEMATRIRAEVNAEIFRAIVERMGADGRRRMEALLSTPGPDGRSMFNRLKKPAQRATWSRFKAQSEYLDQVDALGDTAAWLAGIAPSKIADFAGEAAAQDVDTLSRYEATKRVALVACLVHSARMRARDDLAEMLCKRVAANVKKAKAQLEEIRDRQRATSKRLIGTYRTVLEHLDPESEVVAGRAAG